MESSTQTLTQIISQEFMGHLKQHFMTSPVTYVTNGIQDLVKCCMKNMDAPRTSTRQDANLLSYNLNTRAFIST